MRETGTAKQFQYPAFPGSEQGKPVRDRNEHGSALQAQLREVALERTRELQAPVPANLEREPGTYLRLESAPGFPLKLESLENRGQGIELVAVTQKAVGGTERHPTDQPTAEEAPQVMLATVFVPEGKLAYFEKRIRDYLEKETPNGNPRNQDLVESIERFGLAKLNDLWTDPDDLFPGQDEQIWWEAWLRRSRNKEEQGQRLATFQRQVAAAGLQMSENVLTFPEHSVTLVKGSPRELAQSVFLLDSLAELRRAKETAEFYVQLEASDARDWVDDLTQRLQPPHADSPAVCLLDSGVTGEHPLIRPALDPADLHTYHPEWGTADSAGEGEGHGTEMAGLSLYGDLVTALDSTGPVVLNHRLESVKMLPPVGAHEPRLYGDVTRECVSRPEVQAPFRNRAYCLTITSRDNIDRGRPSSWSATIDALCAGVGDEQSRIMLVSAGNAQQDSVRNYPHGNHTDSIHDPGQAWNAITVGACTDKDQLDQDEYPGWRVLAPRGGLCPSSTTSHVWDKDWPLKPDIVLEGGNWGVDPAFPDPPLAGPDALRLLTTYHRLDRGPFTVTGDTSAATAQAARMAAEIQATYPNLWPETVRALLVHSAWWTPEMTGGRHVKDLTKAEVRNLICCFGYGVPNLNEALYDAGSSLTLIVQDELRPFEKPGDGVKAKEMRLHHLPWPEDVLREIGDVDARLRVTLSYYVEPNPGNRGYTTRFSYASHGLRFDAKAPFEDSDEFQARINQVTRNALENYTASQSDAERWVVGPQLRTRGSLHSDIWYGSAAELASKAEIAVFPTSGWWKSRPFLGEWNRSVRYALVVSLRTRSVETDIYTPIATRVGITV